MTTNNKVNTSKKPFDEIDFYFDKFPTFGERLKPSHKEKQELISTNIPLIDEVLGGILNTDLILCGASTGLGKTQLAMNIAKNVALQNKQVVLFSLESYEGEIEDRLIFSELSKKVYQESNSFFSFKEWVTGNCNKAIYDLEGEIIKKFDGKIKDNLRIRYRDKSSYSANQFCEEIKLLAQREKIKLIVIDHLHYFDIPDGLTENLGIKNIMFTVRDIGQFLKIPIILIAHLRKTDIKSKTLAPSEFEFHGSSEIIKNSTAILTIAPAEFNGEKKYLIPTYFRAPKLRFDEGGKKRYLYCSQFNLRTGEYENTYRIFRPKSLWTDKEDVLEKDLPNWAINAKRIGEYEARFNKS